MKLAKFAVGVDLGTSTIKAGIVIDGGVVIKREKVETTTPSNLIKFLTSFLKAPGEIDGIGIGVPGPLDLKSGKILDTPNLKTFANCPIVNLLKDAFGLPVFLGRDTNCALLGEKWRGFAKNYKNVVMLTLGTGVGGAILIDGKLYTGSHGMGAEIGHMIVNFDGALCGCGRRGCLESEIGEKGIVSKFGIRPQELIDQIQQGFEKAINKSRQLGSILGVGLASIVNIFDPEIIILAGGQVNLGKVYIKEAIWEMQKRTLVPNHPVKVVVSELGDQAAIIGAAKMVFDKMTKIKD